MNRKSANTISILGGRASLKLMRRSSQGWHENVHDPMPWVGYFLGVVRAAYDEFARDVGELREGRGMKTSARLTGRRPDGGRLLCVRAASALPAWVGTCSGLCCGVSGTRAASRSSAAAVLPAGERSRRSETGDNGRKGVIKRYLLPPSRRKLPPSACAAGSPQGVLATCVRSAARARTTRQDGR